MHASTRSTRRPGVREKAKNHAESRVAMRESRLVVLPEFQGLGLGPATSDAVAERYVRSGRRYLSKTAHPR